MIIAGLRKRDVTKMGQWTKRSDQLNQQPQMMGKTCDIVTRKKIIC